MKSIIIFGATGALGSDIALKFKSKGWNVVSVGRSEVHSESYVSWDPCQKNQQDVLERLSAKSPFNAVCWAQGMNLNDSIDSYERESHEQMYKANVIYILESLNFLLKNNLVGKPAKFCVISSIWQNLSKKNKLSYTITKSALQGLVLSLSNDMAKNGHLFNAVLPGAIESPMTRKNLTQEQIISIERATQFGILPSAKDTANTVYFLCSEDNTGITGNFIKTDLGFSNVRNI
jgi:3-oxoacyl-[acyl-carrier protein] reductase